MMACVAPNYHGGDAGGAPPEDRQPKRLPYQCEEGVCYAKKDFNVAKHPEIDVPNLQVIKLMQTFKSNEYVKETFAWMHYYWYLTNEGIEFLRTYLNLPCDIVPATLKKSAKPLGRPMGEPHGDHPRPYEGRKPDATFSFTDEDFYKVATGKMNPQISFMSLLIQLHHEIKWALGNAYRRKFL